MKPDPLLEAAIKGALIIHNQTDGASQTQITLSFGGMVIVGTIIPLKEYMQSNALFDAFDEISGSRAAKKAKVRIPHPNDSEKGYVHLKNARFVFGGGHEIGADKEGHFFWRGRLDSISGFSVCGF